MSIPIIGSKGLADPREIHVTLRFMYPAGVANEQEACRAIIDQISIPFALGLGPAQGIAATVIHPPPVPPPPTGN